MTGSGKSRRSFLKTSVALAGAAPLLENVRGAEEWTRGSYPRSFHIDPSGQFLYCCNQRGDNIAVFRVDRKTGGLSFTSHYVPVGNPSSIVFLDRKKGE
jgi:6-phosphogluconolactonase (cycloisomerase 2 family)